MTLPPVRHTARKTRTHDDMTAPQIQREVRKYENEVRYYRGLVEAATSADARARYGRILAGREAELRRLTSLPLYTPPLPFDDLPHLGSKDIQRFTR